MNKKVADYLNEENNDTKYNEIAQELYGKDYVTNSVNELSPLQKLRCRKTYEERQGHFRKTRGKNLKNRTY